MPLPRSGLDLVASLVTQDPRIVDSEAKVGAPAANGAQIGFTVGRTLDDLQEPVKCSFPLTH